MRIVIDTNILVSAIFFDGLPENLIRLVLENLVNTIVSKEIIQEYEDTIQEMVLKTKKTDFCFSLVSFLEHVEIIMPKTNVEICRDADDNKFINCALDGNCNFIISGDHDLLVLKEYQNIKIISVREFFHEYF